LSNTTHYNITPKSMKINKWFNYTVIGAGLFTTPVLLAGTNIWFTPLTESAAVLVAGNSNEELTAPFVTPTGIQQVNWISLAEVENAVLSPGQSVVRVAGQGTSASMFDMLALNPAGTHIFIPHETPIGAGVTRYNIATRHAEVLFKGDASGNWTTDYGAFDPARWTPNGTIWLGEEWAGEGRIIEVTNPMAAPADIVKRELHRIPNVSQEGINFSLKYKDTIYLVDESQSGSIYKVVFSNPADYTAAAQVFALKVDAYTGSANLNWDHASNVANRTGLATWIPLTDANGVALPGVTDPFTASTSAGRTAADNVGATPYGRPEDMVVSRLANGREVVYVANTSEAAVISIEILSKTKVKVGTLVSNTGTPKNLGFPATTGVINAPDNLAMDAAGNIYVIEDNPNSGTIGGDTWFIRDTNNDGVAESADHFLSLRVPTSEATGMIFNHTNPTQFYICVQHPKSTDLGQVPNGLGDAIWAFDLKDIPNQNFVNTLKRGRMRNFTNQ
jgi:uncharacterized protein